jgi:hypothetical protein
MYVEHSVIISTIVSHNRVEFDLGKKALQLLEDHTRFMKRFYGNRKNPSSQAPPNFYVGLRLTRERCGDSSLRSSGQCDRNARARWQVQGVMRRKSLFTEKPAF